MEYKKHRFVKQFLVNNSTNTVIPIRGCCPKCEEGYINTKTGYCDKCGFNIKSLSKKELKQYGWI